MKCWGVYTTLDAMEGETQDTLDNCSTTSPLFLSTNQNDPETLCLYVWGFLAWTLKVSCTFGARCPMFQTANTPKSGIKKAK